MFNFSCTVVYLQVTSVHHTTQLQTACMDLLSWGHTSVTFIELWYLQVTSFHHEAQFCRYKYQSYLDPAYMGYVRVKFLIHVSYDGILQVASFHCDIKF